MGHSLFSGLRQMNYQSQAESTANRSAQQASESRESIRELQRRLDKLMLINMAMWSLLQDVSDLTEKDLEDRVQQIDLADGELDGKIRNQARTCIQCGRIVSAKHSRCLYCDTESEGEHGAFSDVL